MPHRRPTACLLLAAIVLGGCSNALFPGVYRIDIEQGNIVTQDMLDKLKAGMTEAQVRFVMGSPQLTDAFEPERWIYLYRLRRGDGELLAGRAMLHFRNGTLDRWEGEATPEAARNRYSTAAARNDVESQ